MRTFLIFLLYLISGYVQGQTVDSSFIWTEKIDTREHIHYLGRTTIGSLVFVKHADEYIRGKPRLIWRKTEELKSIKEVEIPRGPGKISEILMHQQRIFVFRTKGQSLKGEVVLWADIYDEEGQILKRGVTINKIGMQSYGDWGEFILEPIPNQNKWICYAPTFSNIGKPTGKTVIWDFYTGDTSTFWMEYPYAEEESSWEEIRSDSLGNIFLLTQDEHPDGAITDKYWLHLFQKSKEKWSHLQMKGLPYPPKELYILTRASNFIQIAGTYAESEDNRPKGVFLYNFDLLSLSQTLIISPFDSSFFEKFQLHKRQDENFQSHLLKAVLSVPHSFEVVYVFEKIYTSQVLTQQTPTRNFQSNTLIHFTDLDLLKLSASGNVSWLTHIPKEQHCPPEQIRFASASIFTDSVGIHLFFNENIQKGGILKGVFLGWNADFRSYPLLKLKRDELLLPEDCFENNNQWLLPLRLGENFRIYQIHPLN